MTNIKRDKNYNKFKESKLQNLITYIKMSGICYVIKYGSHKLFSNIYAFIFKTFVSKPEFVVNSELDIITYKVFYNNQTLFCK